LLDTLPRYNIHSSLIQCPYLSFSSFPPFFSFFFGGKFQIRSLEFTKLVCEHSPRSFLLRSPWRLGHLVGKRRRIRIHDIKCSSVVYVFSFVLAYKQKDNLLLYFGPVCSLKILRVMCAMWRSRERVVPTDWDRGETLPPIATLPQS
jgi:hypothetical protein